MMQNVFEKMIRDFYREEHPELIITPGIMSALSVQIIPYMEEHSMNDVYDFMSRDAMIDFIKQRQPNLSPVPAEVMDHIEKYFDRYLDKFNPVCVCRKSNHIEDSFMYSVVARHENGTYACWSSWNESLESLNNGHYGYDTEEEAKAVIYEQFHDITLEDEKYGPEQTMTVFPNSAEQRIEETEDNVVAFSRGR